MKKYLTLLKSLLEIRFRVCANCNGVFSWRGVILVNRTTLATPKEDDMTAYCRKCYRAGKIHSRNP